MRALRIVIVVAAGISALAPVRLAAQKAGPPANVTVQLVGNAVTIGWTATSKGVTYHVLRSPDMKSPGVEIVKPVYNITSVVDPGAVPGTTYFYQVIAEATDGSGAADPVQFTVPALVMAPKPRGATMSPPLTVAPGGTPSRSLLATPTAVNGVTVTGTIGVATVSWQPVQGATSYSVTRSSQNPIYAMAPVSGLQTTTWTDRGPSGQGFLAGIYQFQVVASLSNGSTVSGQASWTRPAFTCAAPDPTQQNLAALNPVTGQNAGFVGLGSFPTGMSFRWINYRGGNVGYRVERSVQGSNAWAVMSTSCGGQFPIISGSIYYFDDHVGGITPGVTYLYKLTALASTGDYGEGTVTWVAPSPFAVQWIDALVTSAPGAAASITLDFRYLPPQTNAPMPPYRFKLTTDYGASFNVVGPCSQAIGCTATLTQVPSGFHKFTLTASWARSYGTATGQGYSQGYGFISLPAVPAGVVDTTVAIP